MKMKVLSIVLCCILLIGILAGCTGTNMESPTAAPTDEATKETAEPGDDKEPVPSDDEGEFEYHGNAPIVEDPITITWVGANTGVAG